MYIDRRPLCLILIALSVLPGIVSAAAVADRQSNASAILELNDSMVNSTLAKYPFLFLDFYEQGCDPCQRMNASLHELSVELVGQVTFGMINAKENNITVKRYNITSYPTLLLFNNESLVGRSVGFGSKAWIVDTLRMLKPDLNTSNVTNVTIAQIPAATQIPSANVRVQMNCSSVKKQDQPVLQAFIVSYCPFGLQMQRVLSGIVSKIPSLSKNIKVSYIVEKNEKNMTSMHGQQESDENLRQICIREEQPDKYWKYISSFPESGNSSQCIENASIDEALLNSCLANDSRGLKYAEEDFNITQQYNITGSPTLVMNGEIVSESDFGGRTEQAVKNLLCCGFNTTPDFCSMNLSAAEAKTGFTSNVNIQPCGQTETPESLKTIPLAPLGSNNPAIPVLVTDETIAAALQQYPLFVLMGFADWCGYCQMMNSTVLNLSKEFQGRVVFGMINAEKNNETAKKYNLVSYPRLLIFRNGTLISTQIGYKSVSTFTGILKGLEATENAVSGNDTTLKYLDKILEAAKINSTTGNTINIFIVNING